MTCWYHININSLRPRQNRCHFADNVFKCNFLNENAWIPIKISLKFVPKGPINNIPALVQIMAWRQTGNKPLSGPMMVRLPTHICVTRPQWVKINIQCSKNVWLGYWGSDWHDNRKLAYSGLLNLQLWHCASQRVLFIALNNFELVPGKSWLQPAMKSGVETTQNSFINAMSHWTEDKLHAPPHCAQASQGVNSIFFLAATKQLYEWLSLSVRPSVCLWHLFIRPSLDGTYYGMALSVRSSVRPSDC